MSGPRKLNKHGKITFSQSRFKGRRAFSDSILHWANSYHFAEMVDSVLKYIALCFWKTNQATIKLTINT